LKERNDDDNKAAGAARAKAMRYEMTKLAMAHGGRGLRAGGATPPPPLNGNTGKCKQTSYDLSVVCYYPTISAFEL
jgi:hypothetical protein